MDTYTSYGYTVSSTVRDYASAQVSSFDDYALIRVDNYTHVLVIDPTFEDGTITGDSYILYSTDPNTNFENYYWEEIDNAVTVYDVDGAYLYANYDNYARLDNGSLSTAGVFYLLCGAVCYLFFKHLMKAVTYRLHSGGKDKEVR